MAGSIATIPKFQFSDARGFPLAFGTLSVFIAGSTTPATTWQDEALTAANTNPITLDSRGECVIWLDNALKYKFVLANFLGAIQWTVDNITGAGALAQTNINALQASLAASGGSSLIGFIQAGAGAVARTQQDKDRETVDLADFGIVDVTGIANMTAIFNLAATAAASVGKGLRLPSGTLLLDAVVLPTTLPALVGGGKYATVLKFKRQAYSAGQVLLSAAANTAGIQVSGFTVDCDDAVFKTAGTYSLVLNSANHATVRDVRIFGRGQSAVFTNAMTGGRISGLTVDATGTATNSFSTCFEGQNCLDVLVTGMRTTGLPQYSGVFGAGSYWVKFVDCHTDGTSGSFGFSLGGCAWSHIEGCTARNTSHEAFQLTDTLYCSITNCTAEWDIGNGVDAGISIHGKTVQTRLNKVTGCTVINSYGPGLLCADNAQLNLFQDIILKDCGLRQYAATADPSASVIGQYTAIAGIQCSGQTFRDIKIATESGNILAGYAEANNGAGSVIANTQCIDIEWQGGGVITNRYVFASPATSFAWDLDYQTGTPTISPAGGAITAYSATMLYRRRGRFIEVPKLTVNITTAGTGTGALTVLWGGAPNAAASGGALTGCENGVSGKAVSGTANSGGVVVRLADGNTVIASGATFTLGGGYMLP